MADESSTRSALWDDNPSESDLLGFDAVVAPVVDAINADDLDPLTIGVHAKWGAGKSTLLGLVEAALASDDTVVVIRTNPWEYDDHDDVKGTLISEVLDELQQRFKDEAGLGKKVADLLNRISWSRVAKVVAKGAIIQSVDLKELASALTPKGRESPESMAGFKAGFAELVGLLPAKRRVVVLVDDLDRCLPQATTATLEAIKLFLSVPKMVFVIAADQDMVRDAIAMNLGASPESSRYAQRYLDKIVQLPISLPVLPTHEAEAYLGLLLARPHMSDAEFAALTDHVQARRIAGHAHLLSEMDELESAPSDETVRLASRLVLGLRADKVVNPRELKRFLNAYHVRARVAEVRGLDVRPDVLAKLLILEDRFPADFDTLLAASDAERKALLEKWGEWARDETGKAPKPDGISDDSREWAAVEPDLAPESIGPYLTLAASFASKRQSGTVIDADIAALVTDLTGDSEALRRGALDKVMNRSEGDQRVVLESLLSDARVRATPTTTITSLIQLGNEVEALTQDVAVGLKESCWNQIDVGNAVELASATSPVLLRMAQELVDDDALDGQVRQAARGILHPEATD